MTEDEEYKSACEELMAKSNAGTLTNGELHDFAKKWQHRSEGCRRILEARVDLLPGRYRKEK